MTEKDLQELSNLHMSIDAMRHQINEALDTMTKRIEILNPEIKRRRLVIIGDKVKYWKKRACSW